MCATCPVTAECLGAGLAERYGVWGATSPGERSPPPPTPGRPGAPATGPTGAPAGMSERDDLAELVELLRE
ncbi:MAG: WhiB family transcriptional regulator, partial [Acidimicrobiales bacterium]